MGLRSGKTRPDRCRLQLLVTVEVSLSRWDRHRQRGVDDGLLFHLLDQFDGHSGVAGLVTMDRIRHPVSNHGIQYL